MIRPRRALGLAALFLAVIASGQARSAPPPSGPPTSPSVTPSPRPKVPVAVADCRTAPADRTIEINLQPILSPLGVQGTQYATHPCPYAVVDIVSTAAPPFEVVLMNRLATGAADQAAANKSKEACEGSVSRVLLLVDGEVVDLAASKGVWNAATSYCTLHDDSTPAIPVTKKSVRVLASRTIAGAPAVATGLYIFRKPPG